MGERKKLITNFSRGKKTRLPIMSLRDIFFQIYPQHSLTVIKEGEARRLAYLS